MLYSSTKGRAGTLSETGAFIAILANIWNTWDLIYIFVLEGSEPALLTLINWACAALRLRIPLASSESRIKLEMVTVVIGAVIKTSDSNVILLFVFQIVSPRLQVRRVEAMVSLCVLIILV